MCLLKIFYSSSYKLINPSSFVTLPTVSSFSRRKSPNLDIPASTRMQKCSNPIVTASSTTSVMVSAVTSSALISSPVVLIFKLSTSLSTLTSRRTQRRIFIVLVDPVVSATLVLPSTLSLTRTASTCTKLNRNLVPKFNLFPNKLTRVCMLLRVR